MKDGMKSGKQLEKELYNETGHTSIVRKSGGAIKNYFTKPSTHGGLYLAGVGWLIGGLGCFAREIAVSLYSDGPEIVTKAFRGAWQEAIYHVATSVTKSLLNSAYVASAGGCIGYVGGSILTGRFWDSLVSFLDLRKRNRR